MGGILIDIDSEGDSLSATSSEKGQRDTSSDTSNESGGEGESGGGEKEGDKGKSKGDKKGKQKGKGEGEGEQGEGGEKGKGDKPGQGEPSQKPGKGEQGQGDGQQQQQGDGGDDTDPVDSEVAKIIQHITKQEFSEVKGNLGWLKTVLPRTLIDACDAIQYNMMGQENPKIFGKNLIFLDRQTAKGLMLFVRDADYISDAGIDVPKLLYHLFYKNKIIWSERTSMKNNTPAGKTEWVRSFFYFVSVIPESCSIEIKTPVYMGYTDKTSRNLLTLVKMKADRNNKVMLFDGSVAEENFKNIENRIIDLFSTINMYFWKPEHYVKMVEHPQRSIFMLERMDTFLNMLKMTM